MSTTNHKYKDWKRIGKRGSAYWFIYALMFGFALTMLYIIFGQILHVYVYPTTVELTSGNTSLADKWLGFWAFTPYIIVLIVGLFLFFKLTQRDTTSE